MNSWIFIILYIVFAVSGSTLLKLGSTSSKILFSIPFINTNVTIITLIGILTYGLSFLCYIILLCKYDLSFISPLTVGLVYILLMITAFLFFHEQFTFYKILGSSLILIGIFFVLLKK